MGAVLSAALATPVTDSNDTQLATTSDLIDFGVCSFIDSFPLIGFKMPADSLKTHEPTIALLVYLSLARKVLLKRTIIVPDRQL